VITIFNGGFNIDKTFYLKKLEVIAADIDIKGAVTIKLGDEEESSELNNTFLQKDYATDVLSFPFNEELPDGYYSGDIFICFPIAEKQAVEKSISLRQELFTLMVHGILHLAGYDHEADKGEMLALQELLVSEHFPAENL
jgi:probable rRNA maturation factor